VVRFVKTFSEKEEMMRSFRLAASFILSITLFHCLAADAIAAPAQGPSVVAIFLKLDGITGASTDEKHPGEIEVVSFNWSESNKDKGKVDPHDALILKAIDATTPKLAQAVAEGKTIPQALVTVRATVGGKPVDLVQYIFSDVQITVVSHTVIQRAEEQVQFKYGKLTIRYLGSDGKTVEATATKEK
jgi:type VI secretion system secreted protein Hcp